MTLFTGIEHPIIQAPMAGVQGNELTIAVCKAGGLGSLPCAMLDGEQIDSELQKITSATSAPYNVNFFCHQQPAFDQLKEAQWRAQLAPYLALFDINKDAIPQGAGRQPFSQAIADVLENYKPPVISFHFGLPDSRLLERVKSWGSTILSTATTVDEALWLEANGADAIIAQGLEAGGHRGMFLTEDLTSQSGTFSLLPQIAAAVKVPVVAAGGICDRQGINAALTLGAAAVQMGTAFLLCDETKTSALHRAEIVSDNAKHSAITNVFSGRPARSIVNKAVSMIGPINPQVQDFPHAAVAITEIRKCAEQRGSSDFSPLWCGQNPTGCKAIPAADLIKSLFASQ